MTISAIVITRNEQDWIENCLKSLEGLTDEIIVVDVDSTDDTLKICKKYTSKIFTRDWHGFSEQKNFAVTKAIGEWIFFIDADERVSKDLREEIKRIINSDAKFSAYQIPRLNFLLGQPMKHGGWWPDYVTRLAKKDQIVGWQGELHEVLKVKGQVGKLESPLYHLSHRGINWMLNKSIRYTETEALLRFKAKHPKVVWWRFLRVMCFEFWERFFVKSGWRDGEVGLIEAISQAFNMFLIYVHLWEMQQGKPMEEIYKDLDKKLAQDAI